MDQKLLFLINHTWTCQALDYLMALLSNFAAWTPPLILLLGALLWRGGFRARAFVLTAAMIVGINDGVVSGTLKKLVGRPRPHQVVKDVRMVELAKARPRLLALGKPLSIRPSNPSGKDVEGRSFPSSHTINTISVALVCACFYRRFGWLAFIPAVLVGWSRIYTGSHWPSDVAISILIGLGSTLLLLCGLEWLWRKLGARYLPAVHRDHPSLLTA